MPVKSAEFAARAVGAGVALYQAYRGRSDTTTMRENRSLPVLIEPGEYTRKNRKSGRYKKRNLKNVYRILATSQQPQWYRFSGKKRFNAQGGFFPLSNHLSTGVTPNVETLPFYFFELSQCINFNGTVQNPNPFYAVQRTNAGTPSYQLIPWSGTTDTGSLLQNWILENTPGQTSYPGRCAIHKYSDIRFICYGARGVPIKYDISIISFPDDEYNPFNGQYAMTTTGNLGVTGLAPILLDNLISPYASNPINIQDPKLRSKIRYHFRENFIIQPGSTTDGDNATPHFRELRIFKKWDLVNRFDWGPIDRADPQSENAFQQNLTAVNPVPNFPARKYMMIRATSLYTSGPGPPLVTIENNATFDLLVRNKWDVPFG